MPGGGGAHTQHLGGKDRRISMRLKTARTVTQKNYVLKQTKKDSQTKANQRPEHLNPQIPAFTKHDWSENQTHTPAVPKIRHTHQLY